jgi:hypothetical protein
MIKSNEAIRVFPNHSKNGFFIIEFDQNKLTSKEIDIEILNSEKKVVFRDNLCKTDLLCMVDVGLVRGMFFQNVIGKDLQYIETEMVD